uniref:Transmembrane protein n=1 Tax=Heligmosomoides polygyrus TaxID=6339 RepID=A0A183GGS5_HELPZ
MCHHLKAQYCTIYLNQWCNLSPSSSKQSEKTLRRGDVTKGLSIAAVLRRDKNELEGSSFQITKVCDKKFRKNHALLQRHIRHSMERRIGLYYRRLLTSVIRHRDETESSVSNSFSIASRLAGALTHSSEKVPARIVEASVPIRREAYSRSYHAHHIISLSCANVECWIYASVLFKPESWPFGAILVSALSLYGIIVFVYVFLYVPIIVGKPLRILFYGGRMVFLPIVRYAGRGCLEMLRTLRRGGASPSARARLTAALSVAFMVLHIVTKMFKVANMLMCWNITQPLHPQR